VYWHRHPVQRLNPGCNYRWDCIRLWSCLALRHRMRAIENTRSPTSYQRVNLDLRFQLRQRSHIRRHPISLRHGHRRLCSQDFRPYHQQRNSLGCGNRGITILSARISLSLKFPRQRSHMARLPYSGLSTSQLPRNLHHLSTFLLRISSTRRFKGYAPIRRSFATIRNVPCDLWTCSLHAFTRV
jgi:hypothetical protein